MSEKGKDLEKKKSAAMATMNEMFEEDAGHGVEGADKESYAIPFLIVLQPLSPVVVDELVEGAKPGMIMNTVSNKLYKEADIIPVAFARRFIQWQPREVGGKFNGIHMPSDVDRMLTDGHLVRNEDGKIVNKDGDLFRDTRQHYVLVNEDGVWLQAMLSMASTQVKRSKRLMTVIGSYQKKNKDGMPFNPPSYARVFNAKTEKEQNEHGTWYSWVISPVRDVEDPMVYTLARAFHKMIVEGKVKVDHEQERSAETPSDNTKF